MKRHLYSITWVAALAAVSLLSCQKSASTQSSDTSTPPATAATANTLTDEEKTAGWELLFDGTSFNGWKRYGADTIGPLWTIKDGVIICDGAGLTEGTAKNGGSLMTTRQFGNFELTFDWKISPGGNSGVLYHVIEDPKYKHDYETGPEYQVMDDGGWKGDKLRDPQKVGSNYDMYAAPVDTKKVMPVGEWNSSKLVYNNGHVEQWLNGQKVVEFEEGSADFQERYKKSKWVDYPAWNKSKTGAISLQDHGAPVYYKNIKIHAL